MVSDSGDAAPAFLFPGAKKSSIGRISRLSALYALEERMFELYFLIERALLEDVMDVVFSVCIVRRGAVGARVWGV